MIRFPFTYRLFDYFLILIVFGLAGTATLLLSRVVLIGILGLEGSLWSGPWGYRVAYLLLIPPSYSIILIAIGSSLGRRKYFFRRALSVWSRPLGLLRVIVRLRVYFRHRRSNSKKAVPRVLDEVRARTQSNMIGMRQIPMEIKAVVFDFDDTLADTVAARVDAARRTFEEAGITSVDPEVWIASNRGIPLQIAFDGFENGHGKELGLLQRYRYHYWMKGSVQLSLFDGVWGLLSDIRAAGRSCGIVTSKSRDIRVDGRRAGTLVELHRLGLDWMGPHTIGFEDVSSPKPNPEGLNRLLSAFAIEPSNTLVVGDSDADMEMARSAGCWSCLAGWGIPREDRDSYSTIGDLIVEHPSAVSLILGLGR